MRESNIHTHSVFSDGKATPEEMLCRAIEQNFVSFGISDHSETQCDLSYCMKKADYPRYRSEVRRLREKYEDRIEYLLGIEKDYYSDVDYEAFDYVIGSVHYLVVGGVTYPIDHSLSQQMDCIRDLGKGDRNELARRYYAAVAEHAQKEPFQIQGHFDVITKFGVFDGADETYYDLAFEALDEVIKHVPFIEVNTGAVFRKRRTAPYPEEVFLRRILEKNGKVILTGDSHDPDAVGFFFEESRDLLRKIGFREIWRLRKNGFEKVDL